MYNIIGFNFSRFNKDNNFIWIKYECIVVTKCYTISWNLTNITQYYIIKYVIYVLSEIYKLKKWKKKTYVLCFTFIIMKNILQKRAAQNVLRVWENIFNWILEKFYSKSVTTVKVIFEIIVEHTNFANNNQPIRS